MASPALQRAAAYLLVAAALSLVLFAHLVPAVLAGLLAYVLSRKLLAGLRLRLPSGTLAEKLVGLVVGLGSLALLTGLGFAVARALNGETISDLLLTLADTLEHSRKYLPESIAGQIPESVMDIKHAVVEAAKSHASSLATVGKSALHALLLVLVGWLIGVLVACQSADTREQPLFAQTWNILWSRLSTCFQFVVFAQVKVAAFNSAALALYLLVVCPLVGWQIPYAKSLVLVTFLCGLLPVLGNLISNTVTFILALTVSVPAAIAALGLLVVIHKLEYLIISKALGADIGSSIWELLIVLFLGETLFGVAGMVFAPVLYAFVKGELRMAGWLRPPPAAHHST